MLRPATDNDFDFIYRLYMHPLVNRYLLYETMEAGAFKPIARELLEKKQIFIYESEGRATGMCKLVPQQHRDAHRVYLGGLAIHPDHAGKGEGKKMLEEIVDYCRQNNFLRIELTVAAENEKAIHLYEKAGFVKEGLMKKFTFLKSENKFLDEVMMALLL
jgi:RimJ/RimL family protein N-acetyltransferase